MNNEKFEELKQLAELKKILPEGTIIGTYNAPGSLSVGTIEHVENLFPGNADLVKTILEAQAKQKEQVAAKSVIFTLRPYIDILLPYIKNSRCWFGVAKALMEKGYVGDEDFDGACIMILQEFKPGELQEKLIPNARDLKSLNCLSAKRKIAEWKADDQPFGDAFSTHLTIALRAFAIIPIATFS